MAKSINGQFDMFAKPEPQADLFSAPASQWVGSRITLHRTAVNWFARHTGPLAAEVERACGTNDICTGFLSTEDPETVHAAIAKLNPEYLVVIEDL